jgi:hypothetical protein
MPAPKKYATEEERVAARRESRKKWELNNPGHKSQYKKNNREKINAKNKAYRQSNPDKASEWQERYRRNNPEKFRKSQRDYRRKRYWSDEDYRLQMQLRSRLTKALGRNSELTAAISECGCTLAELRERIESQFLPGMSWDSRSDWHIDHIYPLSAIDRHDRRQVIAACNWRNLRPVWAAENWRKNAKVTPEAEALFIDIMESLYPEVICNAEEV